MAAVKISHIEPMEGHRILINFSTGERKMFDAKPYLSKPFFKELNDEAYFRQVMIDPLCHNTVVWPNEQDIAPHELYDLSVPVGE